MKKILAIILLTFSFNLFAANISLANFMEDELLKIATMLGQEDASIIFTPTELTRIRIRVKGKVGVQIPFLAGLEIKPFVEFYLDR